MSNKIIFDEIKIKNNTQNCPLIINNNSFTSSNLFIKKDNYKKNKSQNKSIKRSNNFKIILRTKIVPTNTSNIKYYNNLTTNQNIKDDILMELKNVNKEIKNNNKELNILKKNYEYLKSTNLINKFIIEKVLALYEDKDINNEMINNLSNEEIISEEENIINNYNKELINIDELMKNNYSKISPIKYNNIRNLNFNNEEKNKAKFLKKHISLLNKSIDKNNNSLNEIKNKKNLILYQHLINSINYKNKKSQEMAQKVNELNYKSIQNETKIKFYTLKNKDYIEAINKLKERINIIKRKNIENEKFIKIYKEKKDYLNKSQLLLEEEIKKNENQKINVKEEEKQLNLKIKENNIYIKEKENNKKFFIYLEYERNKLEKEINRIQVKISILNNTNKKFSEYMKNYENERLNLLEKSKI